MKRRMYLRTYPSTKFLRPQFQDCKTNEEKCVWLLKNLKNLKGYPEWLQSSEYKSFAVSAEIANFDDEKKRNYDKVMTDKENQDAINATCYRQGKAEGKLEGAAQKAISVAKALLSKGADIELICYATGLTIEQVNAL